MKRSKRAFLWAMLGLFVIVGSFVLYRWNIEQRGHKELAAVLASIDTTDPDWKHEAHPAPPFDPHADTVVAVIARSQSLFPPRYPFVQNEYGVNFTEDTPHNARLDDTALARLEAALEGCERVRPVARQLVNKPTGCRPLQATLSDFGERIFTRDTDPDAMSWFIRWECERFNTLGDSERALQGVHGLCQLALIYDHPSCWYDLYGIRNRSLEMVRACKQLERVLGMGAPHGLATVQTILAREATVDYDAQTRVAQRAEVQACYEWFTDGAAALATKLEAFRVGHRLRDSDNIPYKTQMTAFAFRPHMPANHAASLRYQTALVANGRLPTHQRLAADIVAKPVWNEAHILGPQMDGYARWIGREPLMAQAKIRCTVVALAAEQYRQLAGQWPASIAVIPKTLLPTAPLDPFTGQTLLLQRRPDGLTIYSVGPDGTDDLGDVPTTDVFNRYVDNKDIGFRLYNPEQRCIAPASVRPARNPWEINAPRFVEFGPMPRVVEGP